MPSFKYVFLTSYLQAVYGLFTINKAMDANFINGQAKLSKNKILFLNEKYNYRI